MLTQPSAISWKFVGKPYDLNSILTPDEVWAKLDLGPEEVRQSLIMLINELKAVVDANSGADNIGMTPITVLGAPTTIQSVIEALVSRLQATTDNASGADLIGATSISGLSGASVQALLESLKSYVDSQTPLSVPNASITDLKLSDATGDIKERFNAYLADSVTYVSGLDKTGVTDCSAQIQSAIDSVDRGIIQLPTGILRINSKLSCNKNNITIRGMGTDKTVLMFYGTGDALETNKGSWNGTTYTPGTGVSIGSTIWEDFTINGVNGTNVVGLQLAGATRGCQVNRVKFVSCFKGLVARESWYNILNNCIFEENSIGAEFDNEDNDFVLFHCTFANNGQHISFPGTGSCRKFSLIGGSLDGLGTNGGAYFKSTQALTIQNVYMERYSTDTSQADFIKLDPTCYATDIRDNLLISPTDASYTGTWLKLNGAPMVNVDGNFNYRGGAVSLDTTNASSVEIGNNRFEGSMTVPATTLVKLKQTSVRFPSTTTTGEWKEAVCRSSIGQVIPRVTVSFDADFTPGNTFIQIIRQDTSAVVLNAPLGNTLIPAYTPVDLGKILALSPGVLLLAKFYKSGLSVDTPTGTITIEQL